MAVPVEHMFFGPDFKLINATELNFLACKSTDAAYYDLYLQTGSDTPSGKTCSNYQTIHLPCLC